MTVYGQTQLAAASPVEATLNACCDDDCANGTLAAAPHAGAELQLGNDGEIVAILSAEQPRTLSVYFYDLASTPATYSVHLDASDRYAIDVTHVVTEYDQWRRCEGGSFEFSQ